MLLDRKNIFVLKTLYWTHKYNSKNSMIDVFVFEVEIIL
jgi:hypothetical protein